MAEISCYVLIGIGILTSVISFITIFKVKKPFFFWVTLLFGIGIIIYGLIKLKNRRKQAYDLVEQRKKRWHQDTTSDPNLNHAQYQAHNTKSNGPFSSAIKQNQPVHYQAHKPHRQYINHNHQQTASNQVYQYNHHVNPQQPLTPQSYHKLFCPQCGAHIEVNYKFCSSCGNKL